jgi:membrane-associated phospholipid phosphatase
MLKKACRLLSADLTVIFKHYRHFFAIIPYFLSLAWFGLLQAANTRPVFIMSHRFDEYIPFVKEMIIPYFLWFGLIAAVLVFLLIRAPADYVSCCIFMGITQLLVCVFYALYPNGHSVSPVVTGTDIFSRTIYHLNSFDLPTNCIPSLHTTQTMTCLIACLHYKNFGKARTPVIAGVTVLSVAIILSTVMIKQHSVIDLIAGFAVVMACYPFVYTFRKKVAEDEGFVLPFPPLRVRKSV